MGNSRFETEDWSKPKYTDNGKKYRLKGVHPKCSVRYLSTYQTTEMAFLTPKEECFEPIIADVPYFLEAIRLMHSRFGVITKTYEQDLIICIEYKKNEQMEWKKANWMGKLQLEEVEG